MVDKRKASTRSASANSKPTKQVKTNPAPSKPNKSTTRNQKASTPVSKTPAKKDTKKSASKDTKKDTKKSASQDKKKDTKKSASQDTKKDTKKDVKKTASVKQSKPEKKAEAKDVQKKKSEPKIVKVITKGGAAVDNELVGKNSYRVYVKGGTAFTCTLNQSNVGQNNNKFYINQLLQHETSGQLFVFNRWGRVGVPGQQALKGPFSEPMAINEYEKKKREKKNGGYTEIEINYDEAEETKTEAKPAKKNQKQPDSKLPNQVQDLMRLIFDMKMINTSMKEIGYDAKKMPLGKLGDSTITQAFKVLNDLSQEIQKSKPSNDLINQYSSKFYSLIPHDFGFKNMANFILKTDDDIKKKMDMLQSLTDMKLTAKIIEKSENSDDLNIVDQNYKSLKNKIVPVDPKSEDYKMVMDYIADASKSGGYGNNNRKVKQIFKLEREGDEERYDKKIKNDQLLWHGSRLQNFGGILSQGLRIAPPEAPVNGYVYGKGLYFANSFNTSDGYSYNHNNNQSLILLCKVAVGATGPLKSVNAPCIAPQYNSCLGYSRVNLPEKVYTEFNKMKVPSKGSASMAHNAYIVYNVNQATLKYVIWYER